MNPLPVTSLHAALLGLMLLWLSLRVIRERARAKVALGHGEAEALLRASRAQGNFVEYVPLALLLLALLESAGTGGWLLHPLGAALLAGRLLHGIGIARMPEDMRLRQAGMGLTFGVLGVASALLLLRVILG
ncbi:MAG: MAPEG family protein [Roseococcus sp.]|jgi:uncharacterized membrane protein YecN with MAPEG domain